MVCCAAWHAGKKTCTSKTPPCVLSKRPHVFNMRALCRCTRRRFERTHGGVLPLSPLRSLLSHSLCLSLPFFFPSSCLSTKQPLSGNFLTYSKNSTPGINPVPDIFYQIQKWSQGKKRSGNYYQIQKIGPQEQKTVLAIFPIR